MASSDTSVCGVLLRDGALEILGDIMLPYVKDGSFGKYIYCSQAVQNGNFMEMTFDPAQTDGSVKDRMVVSIPIEFVKVLVKGATETGTIGFIGSPHTK